ncbi:helix-turn-helix transcriptional regulator [Leifsonia xyli]|uniref:helix-turn-helix transcriptional regulator n=1 Tax=Leifsonia xyli TaxID=1575 RepID=UPI003D675F47
MANRDETQLGAFLRATRASTTPDAAGFGGGGTSGRRVPGLRREEVAVLAGVSVDYYARLEQGRERNPSPQVLDAIGSALRLAPEAREHLFRLAGVSPQAARPEPSDEVHPALLEVLTTSRGAAAYVLGRAFDVLATNDIAAELLAPFGTERNMVRVLFTHPRAAEVFPGLDELRANTVGALRLNLGLFPGDPRIRTVLSQMAGASPEFWELWRRNRVSKLTRAFKVFQHPVAGRIELTYQTFETVDAPGQQLLIGTPASGSSSEAALRRLASAGPE